MRSELQPIKILKIFIIEVHFKANLLPPQRITDASFMNKKMIIKHQGIGTEPESWFCDSNNML